MHQFTLNSFGSWCLCHLPPKTLILSGAHKIHTCFLIKTVNSLTGKKATKPRMSQALETAKCFVLLLLVCSLLETRGHIIYFRF